MVVYVFFSLLATLTCLCFSQIINSWVSPFTRLPEETVTNIKKLGWVLLLPLETKELSLYSFFQFEKGITQRWIAQNTNITKMDSTKH